MCTCTSECKTGMVLHLVLEIIGLRGSAAEAYMCMCTSKCKAGMVQHLNLEIIGLRDRRQRRSLLDRTDGWPEQGVIDIRSHFDSSHFATGHLGALVVDAGSHGIEAQELRQGSLGQGPQRGLVGEGGASGQVRRQETSWATISRIAPTRVTTRSSATTTWATTHRVCLNSGYDQKLGDDHLGCDQSGCIN